jgi:muramoyltetrapeptide carboxypeptidase
MLGNNDSVQCQPPRLKTGQRVAVVAPAGPPDPDLLNWGVRFLSESGFKVEVGRHVLDRFGYLAGSDQARADDFNRALQDRDIRAIFCARGGYGAARIVNNLDYESVRSDPKIIVGYSDITTLLFAFWQRCRLTTFHGPLMGSQRISDWSYEQLLRQITGSQSHMPWPSPPDTDAIKLLRPGCGSGRLLGGCLSILTTLAGTVDVPDPDSSILFFEEICEAPYRIDRMLIHLRNAGFFTGLQGVICGQFIACTQRTDDDEPTLNIDEIIKDVFHERDIPILSGLPIGHGIHNLTIPIGCRITIEDNIIIQEEAGVV